MTIDWLIDHHHHRHYLCGRFSQYVSLIFGCFWYYVAYTFSSGCSISYSHAICWWCFTFCSWYCLQSSGYCGCIFILRACIFILFVHWMALFLVGSVLFGIHLFFHLIQCCLGSFLMGKLPLDENLHHCRFSFVSRCYLCMHHSKTYSYFFALMLRPSSIGFLPFLVLSCLGLGLFYSCTPWRFSWGIRILIFGRLLLSPFFFSIWFVKN